MFSFIVRPVRAATRALLAGDSPRQLAAGFAIGMVLGLMPKGNLIAMSLCVLIFSLRVNTGLGLLAAVLFSFVGPWSDPYADQLGREVLGFYDLQDGYAAFYRLPLAPWSGFNNTVVLGSFLIGMYLVYPVYWTGYAAGQLVQRQPTSGIAGNSLRSTLATQRDRLPHTAELRTEAA
jgi:uncharacterized protein (TIGR03546 family)